jgi:hypothetical protein
MRGVTARTGGYTDLQNNVRFLLRLGSVTNLNLPADLKVAALVLSKLGAQGANLLLTVGSAAEESGDDQCCSAEK